MNDKEWKAWSSAMLLTPTNQIYAILYLQYLNKVKIVNKFIYFPFLKKKNLFSSREKGREG